MAKDKEPLGDQVEYELWVDSFKRHCSKLPEPLQIGIISFVAPRHVCVGLWMPDARTAMGFAQVCSLTFPMRFCEGSAGASIFAAAASDVARMIE
jgi:hypothetical protein